MLFAQGEEFRFRSVGAEFDCRGPERGDTEREEVAVLGTSAVEEHARTGRAYATRGGVFQTRQLESGREDQFAWHVESQARQMLPSGVEFTIGTKPARYVASASTDSVDQAVKPGS